MGKKVCVLEKGREWPTGSFPTRFPEVRSELHVTGGKVETGSRSGLFNFKLGRHVHVLTGAGLGGGSLVNAAVALQPDEHVFTSSAWPTVFRQDLSLIEKGFEQARLNLRVDCHEEAEVLTKYKALQGAEQAFDIKVQKTPVAITFKSNNEEDASEATQAICTLCGDCCSGCNVGAKNTIALTYLPEAIKNGAQAFTEILVQYVTRNEDKACWEVFYQHTEENNRQSPLKSICTEQIVLAGGTLGSTEILLRSQEKGLPVSGKLGEGFSANGDIIAFGYDADTKVNAVGVGHPAKIKGEPVGASVSGHLEIVDKENPDHSLNIEEGVLPSALAPLLPVFFVPGGRLLGALKSLIKGVYDGPLSRTQTFFAVSHDDAEGALKLEKDRLVIDWPDINKQPVYARVDNALQKTTEAIGGAYVKNPLASTVMGAIPATAHPLGGCRMGNSAQDGVVNHRCQLFIGDEQEPEAVHAGFYVCDGSVLPRSLGVNPLLTITAVTERAMALYDQET